jgi:hypothetical protein
MAPEFLFKRKQAARASDEGLHLASRGEESAAP